MREQLFATYVTEASLSCSPAHLFFSLQSWCFSTWALQVWQELQKNRFRNPCHWLCWGDVERSLLNFILNQDTGHTGDDFIIYFK